jgi:glycosyltransferase involved in cell wall biosynthesis
MYPRYSATVLLPRVDVDGTGAEGLGQVLVESALRGTPGIGCATGGVSEAVGPGLVLEDPDDPDLERVRALLADPAAGRRSREWAVAEHGPDRAVARLMEALA